MSVYYTVPGLKLFKRHIQNVTDDTLVAIDNELKQSTENIKRESKHISPWDTGAMSQDIYDNMIEPFHYEVVSPQYYSIFNELGTRKMRAQPFLYPAVDKEWWKLYGRLNDIMGG